jgi:hypothetical protein
MISLGNVLASNRARRHGVRRKMNGKMLAAVLVALSSLAMAGCVPKVLASRTNANYDPRPPDCPVEFKRDLIYPPDPLRYEVVGVIRVSSHNVEEFKTELDSQHIAQVRPKACSWGGDSYIQNVRPAISTSRSVPSSVSYVVLRTLGEEEVSITSKKLGIGDSNLREKVAFDTGCARSDIEIVRKREDQGSGEYLVNACGRRLKYKRTGSVFELVSAAGSGT